MPVILSVAGYDPSSGAGVTADVKTAAAHGCFATTCITALTVQTTERVFAVEAVREELVRDTLYELVRDMPPAAVRIGMLGTGAIAEVVSEFLETVQPPNVVLDPVLRSSSGAALLDARGEAVLRDRLLRQVDVCTPNRMEAAVLSNIDKSAKVEEMAAILHQKGCRSLVITGGDTDETEDYLSFPGGKQWFRAPKVPSRATHGTGCAFATAIACNLALGRPLEDAVRAAKEYVRQAISSAEPLGRGWSPMNHLFQLG